MPDMAAIGVVMTSLNTAVNIAKAMMDVHDATAVQGKVFELQRAIIDAQQSVFAANAERSALIDEIREAKEQISHLEAWEAEKQRYELKDVGAGSLAYAIKEAMRGTEPVHNICANCYQKAYKSILQPRSQASGKYLFCKECSADIMVERTPIGATFGKKDPYAY
jgi:hypothetical protein